ncbi:MAG: LCP family protein [Ruminococcus bromii]|nr:LCP family protein [Ruminococcus bromii]MCI7211023.1 LCP family protein [Ruminococcus bromii]MDD6434003.1 LCP family protein [Ruminococcus bromii]
MSNQTKGNLVDISSNTQVLNLYKKRGRIKRIVCIALSVIFLLSGSGFVYYYSVLNSMNYVDISNDNDNTDSTLPSSSDVFGNGTSSNDLLQNSKVLNVMLFGEDNNHGDKYGRTDTMIMLSIDNIHKKIKLTSFQRDTYVYIPGNGYDKINASYTLGGAKLSIQTIEANFGIKIDRYAVVDFESFIKIIDTLGGIDMEVTQDEIDYINYQMYKNDQTDTATTITDAPGNVHLNGQEALWYARDRGLTKGEDDNEIGIDGDDWDRTSRQRKLLETLFDSMKSADLGQIVSIVSSIGPLITTNLKKDEITALVSNALTYLKYDVEQYYVPEEGLWYYDDDTPSGSVIRIADMEKQRLAFAKFIYEVGDSSSNNGNAQTTTSSN